MLKFLNSAAQYVLGHSEDLADLCIVVPSRRAGLFFLRALSEESSKVSLAPRIISIEDLVLEVSGLQLESQAALFFKCYEAYQKALGKNEPFQEFNKWGRLLLQDFNEIDRHLVEPKAIFQYLGDAKRIENWGLEAGEAEDMTKEYLELWPKLALVYEHFKSELLQEKLAYQGLAYRKFYEEVSHHPQKVKDHFGHLIFLGFNALNKAEEEAFSILLDHGLADFYWDIDEYYWKNPKHEAGWFLRRSKLLAKLQKQGKLHGHHQKLKEGKRQVKVIAVSGKNLQAYIANQEMAQIPAEQQSDTALVLADEHLLTGILNNLHPNINSFNLSMGLSLRNSPLSGFFELLMDFALEAERSNRKDKKGNQRYSHRKWNALLSHFILKRFSQEKAIALEHCRNQMLKENALYRSIQELDIIEALSPIPFKIFSGDLNPKELFQSLANFCLAFQNEVDQEKYLNEALFGFYQVFNQLVDLLEHYPYLEKVDESLTFFRDLLSDLSMDLRGEPLSGLQVMGMLETRSLDFKRLIITSLNEGVLPKGKSENSLLPFDIKKKFGLPTYLEKDAVYAYHFYRLLHHAEDLSLLYSTSGGGLGSAEPSRFIRQLELEWKRYNRWVEITHLNATGEAKAQDGETEQVPKTPALMKRLEQMAEEGLSPTGLIQYLKDPLAFYYERVLGLRPEDEIQEDLELPVQGTALHNCLEKYYSIPDPEDPKKRIARSPDESDPIYHKSFEEYKADLAVELLALLPGAELERGSNFLSLETMSQMLQNFLKEEKKERAAKKDWFVESVEDNLQGVLKLANGREVHLRGQADRIDREGDIVHIIDYKSGGKPKTEYQISKVDEELNMEHFLKKPYALQLPLYSLMYLQMKPSSPSVIASIYSLRKPKENPIALKMGALKFLNSENVQSFEKVLLDILSELFNPAIPFKSR